MRIAIFGANGQTGRLLTRRVLDAGHEAVAVTRRPADFPFDHAELTVARADVRDACSTAGVLDGADGVLSTLGVPFSMRPIDTYSTGVRNITAAMQQTGVRRLVVVSSTGAYHYPDRIDTPFALRIVEPVITRTIGKSTYDDQRRMETIVRTSGLDWTIVRPSGLFDLPAATNYVAGEVEPVGGFTARIDLADYMTRLAGDAAAAGRTVVISTTEHTPTMWQMIRREAFKSA
ncbi:MULTISPECIES: NAD(P)H-binding protein [unclassified Mycobacterium]|uniref:NAD(P)-dependent oxidoreductase n=1 Tax=unclassified Mycobacterium TaxID=2642494 RepID=UPI0007403E8B|nr:MULTISPECIES: NAD(P)H-binding protein [unclassified Mycobacterium]KUH85299.1 NAD-dependent epimerase [Mycobacterium sp. GA-0227b]KUH87111.1 NAD-dependent epimerase [Mycobacterium sp. GA-1999]